MAKGYGGAVDLQGPGSKVCVSVWLHIRVQQLQSGYPLRGAQCAAAVSSMSVVLVVRRWSRSAGNGCGCVIVRGGEASPATGAGGPGSAPRNNHQRSMDQVYRHAVQHMHTSPTKTVEANSWLTKPVAGQAAANAKSKTEISREGCWSRSGWWRSRRPCNSTRTSIVFEMCEVQEREMLASSIVATGLAGSQLQRWPSP